MVVTFAIIGICVAIQAATPPGISTVKIGLGDTSGIILYESTTFTTADTLVINFTVTTHDSNSEVEIQFLDQSNQLPPSTDTIHPDTGTHNWYTVFRLGSPGTFTLELQYNHTTKYTNTITVTSSGT